MLGDHVLRYIIELEPADQASEYEKMHLIYENKEYWELCRVGYGGMWRTIIWKGPWWDGTAPRFVLTPVHHQPLSHDEMLDQVIHVHGEEKVWISYAMNEFDDMGGAAVWVQKATTKKPEH